MTWRWLESTAELQERTYGYPIKWLAEVARDSDASDLDMVKLVNYIDWNQVAAVQELAELREEFSWKPWATDTPFVNRERIIKETVDELHFLGNILAGLGCTDEEFWELYRQKQQINRDRKASGTYSAKKGGLAHGSD